MDSILASLLDALTQGKSLACVTIVSQQGSTPRTSGSKMLVDRDGKRPALVAGTVGGGLLESMALETALKVLETGKPELVDFDLTNDIAAGADMICGGRLTVFIEIVAPAALSLFKQLSRMRQAGKSFYLATRMDGKGRCLLEKDDKDACCSRQDMEKMANELDGPGLIRHESVEWFVEPCLLPPHLLLMGAGHVSRAVCNAAVLAGFQVTVADDREEFANAERFPSATDIKVVPEFNDCFAGIRVDGNTYIAILTRGHACDGTVLQQALALQPSPAYIGMIGSRRKRDVLYQDLRDKGVSSEELKRVVCPIGLSIGAETPEEIAVSIVAQLISVRRQA